ncbi:unnamed protein product [Rotaria sp. Silwood2]|nr:unnamed protein product [Rotaria sp. Silwood2]
MAEDQSSKISSSNDAENHDVTMENIVEVFREFVNGIPSETNEQMMESNVVFQQLLSKFQQIQDNNNNYQDVIHQILSLCNELIDTIEKVTFTHMNDFQNCLELFHYIESFFQTIIFMKNEKLLIREIFFALLDLLSKPQICSYLDGDQQTKVPYQEIYKCITNLLMKLASEKVNSVQFKNDDSTIQKYTITFTAMYKRVEHNLHVNIHTEQRVVSDNITTLLILSFLRNLSDRTIIVPWLLGIGLAKSIVECLKIVEISFYTAHQIVSIIYNISRHDEGGDELNTFDGLQILKSIQSSNSESLTGKNNLIISMTIALLSTPKQIRSDNKQMTGILNRLLQITMEAAEAVDHRGSYGFHVSEPLAVFTKVFVDDHSLDYVLTHAETDPQLDAASKIDLFVNLFMKFRGAFVENNQLEQFTCTALLNILWSISFQDQYKTKLQQNKNFLKTINTLAMDDTEKVVNEYVPRSIESMTKAANGILYNLQELLGGKKVDIADDQLVPNIGDQIPIIMISYAHANNHFCDNILVEFQERRNLFRIWIDRDHSSTNEDIWEKIALGIKQSRLVVCLLSQEYYNSKSCRKEFKFAVRRNKSILPVYIGEPGECDWLGMLF